MFLSLFFLFPPSIIFQPESRALHSLYDAAKMCERKISKSPILPLVQFPIGLTLLESRKKLPPPIAKGGSSSEAFFFFLSPPSRLPSLLGDTEILSSSEPFSEWQQDNVSLTFPSFCCRPNFPCFFRSVFYDTPFPLLLLPREKKVFPFVLFLVQKYFFPCQ